MSDAFLSVPTEIGRANLADIKVKWQGGHESVYPSRELRLACPCAACMDEMTGAARLIATSVPQGVQPLKVELVGRYAISIQWSDGHNTGIYPFPYLRKLCPCCQRQARPQDIISKLVFAQPTHVAADSRGNR